MKTTHTNLYDDQTRADAYAGLEFPGTYYLAFRDLPAILAEHARGKRALDFGCGAGRSTRFLQAQGFSVTGVDISPQMIAHARDRDPGGDYHLVADGDLGGFEPGSFDLITCLFTFDNVPTMEKKVALFQSLGSLLNEDGCIVSMVSSPEIYWNEWTSFSTRDFPENRSADSGDIVRIVMLDVPDSRPVEDILWKDPEYQLVYEKARLAPVKTYRPLGLDNEPYSWISETTIAPWTIYVLKPAD
jgi:SAM-dependent methyltransferase